MQVRTVTLFAPLEGLKEAPQRTLSEAARLSHRLANRLIRSGWGVQTRRIATPPWPLWTTPEELPALAPVLEARVLDNQGQFLSLGVIGGEDYPAQMAAQLAALQATRATFFGADLLGPEGAGFERALIVAEAIKTIGRTTPAGYGNLRFAGLANCPPGTPFFPTAYGDPEWERPRVALGLEWCDIALRVFSANAGAEGDWSSAALELRDALMPELWRLEREVRGAADELGVDYGGLDLSLTPAIGKARTAGAALEALGCTLGGPGALRAIALVSGVLKRLPVARCGYNGVMLPLLEDPLLVERATEGRLGVKELLLYSAVCGVGLDTVPLPGDTPTEQLAALLADLATLALRLDKPLSARLFIVTGKAAGELTEFDSPYLYNGPVLGL